MRLHAHKICCSAGVLMAKPCTMNVILVVALSYLLGSIPFGVVWTRVFGAADPRSIGSGNIGATNVLRTGKRSAALLTLLCDGGKGALAVLLFGAGAALPAFFGHLFPIWLGGKGGKGVATFLGLQFVLAGLTGGALACATWLGVALLSKRSSAASIATTLAVLLFNTHTHAFVQAIMVLLLLWRHTDNIKRLWHGTEPTISFRFSSDTPA